MLGSIQEILDSFCFVVVERFFLKKFQLGRTDITLPDGTVRTYGDHTSDLRAELRIHKMRVFREVVLRESIGLAESYMRGEWDCTDLARFVAVVLEQDKADIKVGLPMLKFLALRISGFLNWLMTNTGARSLKNVQEHYDIGNDMYQRFLDPSTLSYTCALYRDPKELSFVQKPQYGKFTLDEAQLNKINYIISKAGITKDDHVLELGCGWGGFSSEAAKRTGCKVTAYNLSIEQVELARERAKEKGLSDRVTYVHEDYRCANGQYDKIVSIGMLEHVGHYDLPNFFRTAERCLKPGGTLVVHTITSNDAHYEMSRREYGFIQKYIFPGATIPAVNAIITAATQNTRFELQHFDNIGEHYALTLRDWRKNFYKNLDEISRLQNGKYDAQFQRMWDFYLCNCEGEFSTGHFGLGQFIFRRPSAEFRSQEYVTKKILPPLDSLQEPKVPLLTNGHAKHD